MKTISSKELEKKARSGEVFDEDGKKVRRRQLKPLMPAEQKDPLIVLARQLADAAKQSDAKLAVVLKTMNDLLVTLLQKETVINIPKQDEPGLKEWDFTAVRVNSDTVNIKGKQIK